MTERFIDGNLVCSSPAHRLARKNFADLGNDVAIVDEPRLSPPSPGGTDGLATNSPDRR